MQPDVMPPDTWMPRHIVCLPLPYKSCGVKFCRTSGNQAITLLSATGVPYGRWGRITACLITTAAFRTADLQIEFDGLYSTLRHYLKGQKKPSGYQLDNFSSRLKNWSTLTVTATKKVDGIFQSEVIPLTTRAQIILDRDKVNETEISYMTLTEKGKQFLTSAAVPSVLEHIVAIRSPREIDLYCWIIKKLYNSRNNPAQCGLVPWSSIYTQFGPSEPIADTYKTKFRTDLLAEIHDIKTHYYPNANIKVDDQGIWFAPSPDLISPKDKASALMPAI